MIQSFEGATPVLGAEVFVAESALVLGRVTLGASSSVWYGSILRGDVEAIQVGSATNLQDRCVIHVTTDRFGVVIGDRVTVGHGAILHGCRIADEVLVGIGATILDGVHVGPGSLVAAGSLLPPGKQYPPGSLIVGSPARVARPITEQERRMIAETASRYVELAHRHGRLTG
ncbi:MAG: gamma carbonic anhydrase family protein [Deltaproteobacteria bacterium]|nr:gamma carbonic anhydrase family protein [Deltaproteobacteria bacterium]